MQETVHLHNADGQPAPWDADPYPCVRALNMQLAFDAIAIGAVSAKRPQPDELMIIQGWSAGSFVDWCDHQANDDPLFVLARRRGVASKPCGEPAMAMGREGLSGYEHMVVSMLPQSMETHRYWWMAVARRKQPFSLLEQQIASLTLRQWHARFNRLVESGAGRLWVGHDGRVILADPWTSTLIAQQPMFLTGLLGVLDPIVGQRWNNSRSTTLRDFAIELSDRPYWVRFHNCPAIDSARGHHWYLELREMDNADLPTIGPLDDTRIARSIAYIHDTFDRSPPLLQIAQSAHMSPFHFHRLFVKHVGISPKQYVHRKQMQVAKWMLRCSRDPIGKIAARTGFASHGHFTSTFHRVVGMSPSQYRDTH